MINKKKWSIVLAAILFIASIVYESVYIINPDEQIILTRFGKIEKGTIKEPGYHIKLYRIDQVVRYPSKQIMANIEFTGCPPRMPAYHATMSFIIVDAINDASISSISSFIDTELTKYGVSIINIDFSG